jgi:hypothetical protein
MSNHLIRYHVVVPLCVFVIALVVGAPVGTAFVVGMMTGCMSMVLMMVSGGQAPDHERVNPQGVGRRGGGEGPRP